MKEILYKSTRSENGTLKASEAILKGLADDGGLFVPIELPELDKTMEELSKMTYQELAYEVLKLFYTDFTEEELKACIEKAYDDKFDTEEIALYADHVAIDEELTRLKIHVEHMREYLNETKPIGRDVEFLVQELNRETNTIGSKAQCIEITNLVLKIKNAIEKIREQAANIE